MEQTWHTKRGRGGSTISLHETVSGLYEVCVTPVGSVLPQQVYLSASYDAAMSEYRVRVNK